MPQNLVTVYSYNGSFPERGSYQGPLGCFECADGRVEIFLTPGRWPALCQAIGLEAHSADPRFIDDTSLAVNWPAAATLIAEATASRSVQDCVDAPQQRRIPASQVMGIADVLACSDLAHRDYWGQIPTSEGPRIRLGRVVSMTGLPPLPTTVRPH